MHPELYTLHPETYTLHPEPYTLHLYTLNPIQPKPHTLNTYRFSWSGLALKVGVFHIRWRRLEMRLPC